MADASELPPLKLSDELRVFVRESLQRGQFTRREICRAAGIEESSLSRFLAGRSRLSCASIDSLADVLHLRFVQRRLPVVPGPQLRP